MAGMGQAPNNASSNASSQDKKEEPKEYFKGEGTRLGGL